MRCCRKAVALMETCWYCGKGIVYEEGIPGAWRLAGTEDDDAFAYEDVFACDGWFQGVHLPAEVS
jgi:hypothetical protein